MEREFSVAELDLLSKKLRYPEQVVNWVKSEDFSPRERERKQTMLDGYLNEQPIISYTRRQVTKGS